MLPVKAYFSCIFCRSLQQIRAGSFLLVMFCISGAIMTMLHISFYPFLVCGNKCVIYLHNFRSQPTCQQSQNFTRQQTCVFHAFLGRLLYTWDQSFGLQHPSTFVAKIIYSKRDSANIPWETRDGHVPLESELFLVVTAYTFYFSYSDFPFIFCFRCQCQRNSFT